MRDQVDPAAGDVLEQAVAVALEAVLRRRDVGQDQAEMLKSLRGQLGQVLAEAPIREDALDGITFRARLAALLDAEIDRLEVRVVAKRTSRAPAVPPIPGEKRRWPRHGVRLSAQVSTGSATADCIVVDLSEGGAQVDFAIPVPLPDRVTLKTSNGEVFPAWCRWTKGTRMGLEFTGAAPMSYRSPGTGA